MAGCGGDQGEGAEQLPEGRENPSKGSGRQERERGEREEREMKARHMRTLGF